MIQNLILSIGLSFAIGLNGAKDNNHNFINNNIPNNVVYDDTNHHITFNVKELNNYTWVNLFTYLQSDYTNLIDDKLNLSIFYYNSNNYVFEDWDNAEGGLISFIYESNSIMLDFTTNKILFTINYEPEEFNNNLLWNLSDTVDEYDDIKNAIELDIQANTTQTSMGNSIINAIKSGLGLIGDLASQFLLGFSTLFWNNTNNTLTPFGTFALVFLGISIVMAIISLTLNIIRNNTGA